jgi:hypothetical protein
MGTVYPPDVGNVFRDDEDHVSNREKGFKKSFFGHLGEMLGTLRLFKYPFGYATVRIWT